MRDYKVGDTVYVKGKIVEIDHDDTNLPYCVNVGPISGIWPDHSDIVDELPTAEPVKPELPKDVVEELEYAKDIGATFDDYIHEELANIPWDKSATRKFFLDSEGDSLETLLNAWCNGYMVEKEKKYNLILGTETDGDTNALVKNNPRTDAVLWLNTNAYANDLKLDKFYQFTQEEIDKYNKNFWIKSLDLNDYKVEVADD